MDDDVFVLEVGDDYLFHLDGKNASSAEKGKALDLLPKLKHKEHKGAYIKLAHHHIANTVNIIMSISSITITISNTS